jgi:hypothetical protein
MLKNSFTSFIIIIIIIIIIIGIVGGGVKLGPLGTAATNKPIVPAPSDYDDGEIGGMIGKGNRSTRRKPAPLPLCPPQNPHAARTRTRAAAVGSQRLTARATARPVYILLLVRYPHLNSPQEHRRYFCGGYTIPASYWGKTPVISATTVYLEFGFSTYMR